MKARLFYQTTVRHWRASPGQFGLMLALLSLGVAVFVSVRLANRAALSSFANFADTLTGQSDWIIRPLVGALPEHALPELRAACGSRPVDFLGIIEATVTARGESSHSSEQSLTLLGVDLLAVRNIAEAKQRGGRSQESHFSTMTDSVGSTPRVWVSSRSHFKIGERLVLTLGDRVGELLVAGYIPPLSGGQSMPENLAVLDLPDLQFLLSRPAQLDRIEVVVEPGADAERIRREVGERATSLGRERWTVDTSGAARETAATMTAAFRLNLTVLSLIALLVGLYLIFQTLDGAVVRRRSEIAILRSLGVPSRWIQQLWLAEAASLGLMAGLIGALVGWVGAQWAVRLIGHTIDTLYFATSVSSAGLDGQEIVTAILLGVGASLVAGWYPARQAAQTLPAQFLGRYAIVAPRPRGRTVAIGLIVALAGVVASRLPPLSLEAGFRFPLGGYLAAFLWIFSAGILTACALPFCAWAGEAWGRRSVAARIAVSYLRLPTTRHRFAVAALVCAIGMAAGMAILIGSFEHSIRFWIEQSLQADLYVTSRAAKTASSSSRISANTVQQMSRDLAVAKISGRVYREITIEGLPTTLGGIDLADPTVQAAFHWIEAPAPRAGLSTPETSALVSESFSERFHRHRGDEVRILTPDGEKRLSIAGVYSDYASERGILAVDRSTVQRWFHDDAVTHLSITLRPGFAPNEVRQRWAAEYPGLTFFENASLRKQILNVFRETFSVTYALEVIGVVVAISSLAISLASVLLDRRDQLTTLRALGFRRSELAWSACGEGVAIATCAVTGGLTLSVALGWLLIFVINKQSFGWTLGYVLPQGLLAALGVTTIVVSAIVSYSVGRWGAALAADREE